jgi:hypothetical protein
MKNESVFHKPVLLIIFNRPETTLKVFEAIRHVQPSHLYIASDAPRTVNNEDIEKCQQARSITENIDWTCEVKRLYQNENLGCSIGPRTAFDWFFSHEEEGIILEDDCVPHPEFFLFAEEMLNRYRANPKIVSINGSNLGFELKSDESYTYSRYMNMWGWATWRDRAISIDYELASWKNIKNPLWFIYRCMRQSLFDFDLHWYKYWQQKFDWTTTMETITWWDWQWIFHQIKNNQFSIVPSKNLISNIGFDDNATHTHEKNNPASNIPTESIIFPLVHPTKLKPNSSYEEHMKWVWCYHKRLPNIFYVKQFFSSFIRPAK